MLAGHRLALALGVVDASAVLGDDELSRKQLIRAGEAMVGKGLAIVLNRAGTKIPLCTLTAVERKKADQEARDAAAAAGDPNFHRRDHKCGLAHAISDPETATRVLTRISKRERFNLGVEPRASRVVIVDLDTAAQAAEFALRCGQARPSLTVRSPGQRDKDGKWVHKDGGHIWFDVPDDVELPTEEGIYTDTAGWSAIWGEHQVLVPPSARSEGPYVLVGSAHPLPQWLLDLIITETAAKQERREEARLRRDQSGPSAIDDWAAKTSWSDILIPDGWTDTGLTKNCGCPQWTAPGDHASPESATAHEPGCSVYVCERGHGPLHVWTDNPSEAIGQAISAYGSRTLTMAQAITYTEGGGQMRRTLTELGVAHDNEPTVLKSSFSTWDSVNSSSDGSGSTEYEDTAEDENEDNDPGVPTRIDDTADYHERMVRLEVERELRRRAALERIAAMDRPPLRLLNGTEFLNAPRPKHLVQSMLYRDSLARMFGVPGGGKSFLALDVALSLALGKFWGGVRLSGEPVIYVMAEGQAVNGDRAEAWLSKKGIDPAALKDRFYVVPDAVMMTETAAAPFVAEVARIRPALVVLDTKNAMMVGEENSATDFAALRRVMDQIRKAADCCVLLVDHTGYEGTRARGTSAGTAAMDTEIRVTKDDDQRPALITAEVTRDKAAEAGVTWAFHLVPEHPAAVLEPAPITESGEPDGTDPDTPEWEEASKNYTLPRLITDKPNSPSKTYLSALARFMMFETSMEQDPDRHGRTLTQVVAAVTPHTAGKREKAAWRSGLLRSWSTLKDKGYLQYYRDAGTDTQERSGPHIWAGPSGSSGDPR